MRRIAAAIAAIALVAGATNAQGQGQGRGNDRGGGKPADAGQGGGNGGGGGGGGQSDRGNGGQSNNDRPSQGQGGGSSMAQSMRGPEQGGSGQNGNGNATRVERGNGGGNGNGNAERGNRSNDRPADRAVVRAGNDNRGRGDNDRGVVIDRRNGRDIVRVGNFASIGPRGLISGCPPGLARKHNGCQPPGQARNDWFGWDRPAFWGLRLGDGRYFYRDGYLVRFGRDGLFGGYIPLLGGALAIGNPWPTYYEPFAFPGYYESYYGLGRYDSYRYADRVIYRVDPETAAITSIAALLTGDDFAVGRPMPIGYDVYNVPYGYRDRYIDGPDAYYRYSDGYIYQVDPETRLVAAAIELLAT